jgi:FkbM family methyltransferase
MVDSTVLLNALYIRFQHLIPDGKFRKALKRVNWAILNHNISRNYTLYNGSAEVTFTDDLLKGQKLVFHDYQKACPLESHREIPEYFMHGLVKEGDYVIDGGAFPGDFSVIASRLVGPKGKVFAFEPNPENREYTLEFVRRNNAKNVEVLPYALFDRKAEVAFSLNRYGSFIPETAYRKTDASIKVGTVPIDAVVATIGKIDLIKMDVEGAEVAAVNGAMNTIRNHKPAFMIASYHRLNDGSMSCHALEGILKRYYQNVKTVSKDHPLTLAY